MPGISKNLSSSKRRGFGWVLASCVALSSIANANCATAVKTSDFLDSIGVCTHITQGKDNPQRAAEALKFAGIHAIRDDGTKNPATLQAYVDVHRLSGAKVVLLPCAGDIDASLHEYETLAAVGALLAAEGPNEPNNWHVTYKGKTSSSKTSLPIAEFQRDLYAAVKSDPRLAGIPVFHSSEAGGSQPDNCGLQFLTIPKRAGTLMPDGTRYADYANTHNYVCDHLKSLVDNCAWNAEDPVLNGKWDGMFVEYGHTWWGKGFDGYTRAQLEKLPRVTTETGWSTSTATGGHTSALSEADQANLFLDLYLAAFARGWSYTFIYLLHDHAGDGDWGLFRADYTPKLSAQYLHNLTTILSAPASSFTAGNFGFSIGNAPATVHELLLQKNEHTFDLVVWGEQVKGTNALTVKFQKSFPSIKVFDPTLGVAPVQPLANADRVDLSVTDHPFVLEVLTIGK